MSKYYKAEDIDNAIRKAHAEAESNAIGRAMFSLHCDVLDLPTIEASEDCISREWVKENMLKYGFLAPDMTVTEFVADAPSVVPTCKHKDKTPNDSPCRDCISVMDLALGKRRCETEYVNYNCDVEERTCRTCKHKRSERCKGCKRETVHSNWEAEVE